MKTSNSISELYDSRDEMAVITRNVIWNIDFLNCYTDKEKDILGKYSSNLFTLNTFYSANKLIVGRKKMENVDKFLMEFWTLVVEYMTPWQSLYNKEISKIDLRENYIATQNVVIQALGRIGNYLNEHKEINLRDHLKYLEKINWKRNSNVWYLRAVNESGRIVTNKKAVMLIANIIKINMNIPLSKEEENAENDLQKLLKD